MKRLVLLFLLTLSSFLFGNGLQAQLSFFETLSKDSLVKIVIETDIKSLIKNKMQPVYQSGKVHFLNGSLAGETHEVEVKARGNIRKTICYYPPIKFKFKKRDFAFHKLKWVNICRDNELMEEVLLREYLCYKLFNIISDHSLDVRLLHADYIDTRKNDTIMSAYGFFIEPIKQLAADKNMHHFEPKSVKPSLLDRYHYPLVSIFEYLIGNTDWHVTNLHNLKFLRGDTSLVPVPYDFDYSGFADAAYATPHESMPIKSVRTRHNKAHCIEIDKIKGINAHVLSKKEEMIKVIRDFPYLTEKEREAAIKYLNTGFHTLENEGKAERIFSKNCQVCD